MGRIALGQVYVRVRRFYPVCIISVCVFCAATSSRSRTPFSLRFGMYAYIDIEIFVPRVSDFTYFTSYTVLSENLQIWDTGPRSLLYNGYRVSFLGVKRPGCRVNHPLPSSAEVKERVELTSVLLLALRGLF